MESAPEPLLPTPTLPLGTHVVTRVPSQGAANGIRPAGMVGVVVAAPDAEEPRYRVRFADSDEALLARRDLTIRKGVPHQGLRDAAARAGDPPLDTFVVLRCVVGSRAYGLDGPDSDTDRRGIYLPPADLHWSLAGVPEQLEHEATACMASSMRPWVSPACRTTLTTGGPTLSCATPGAAWSRRSGVAPMTDDPRMHAAVAAQPHPLLFATISGAHLYGFPSPDSDYDLRGAHILPLPEVVGLRIGRETIESSEILGGLQLDLVSHDVRKFFGMLLKRNGYILEQVCSPLVVRTTPWHAELLSLVPRCITVQHSHHYLGFAHTQWTLFEKESPRRVKPLLHVYRVLLTGIQLMRTGEVEANLERLNETFRLPYIPELIARKRAGPEHAALSDADLAFHRGEYERLRAALEEASRMSGLPWAPGCTAELDDLLVRLRLHFAGTGMVGCAR